MLPLKDRSRDESARSVIRRLDAAGTFSGLALGNCHTIVRQRNRRALEDWLFMHPEDVDTKDRWGDRPLFWAAGRGSLEMIETLILHGADVNARNRRGRTALHIAVLSQSNEMADCVRFLLASGAAVNDLTGDGEHRLRSALSRAVPVGNLEVIDLLLNAGANPDPPGLSPLAIAAYRGRYDIMKRLLCVDVDVDRVNIFGESAIMNAVAGHRTECVELLIEAGARLDMIQADGSCILDKAACYASTEMMKLLSKSQIRGLDTGPAARSRYWQRFDEDRPDCMIARQPHGEETASFQELLDSVIAGADDSIEHDQDKFFDAREHV